jgi:hypothetical protein
MGSAKAQSRGINFQEGIRLIDYLESLDHRLAINT